MKWKWCQQIDAEGILRVSKWLNDLINKWDIQRQRDRAIQFQLFIVINIINFNYIKKFIDHIHRYCNYCNVCFGRVWNFYLG